MFQRFTERARRAVFFSRYEASQYGSPYIDTEHQLLGLLREDHALLGRFLGPMSAPQIFAPKLKSKLLHVSAPLLPSICR